MGNHRRQFSATLKAKIAVEAIKGQRTIQEIGSSYAVHPNQVTKWKKPAVGLFVGSVFDRAAPTRSNRRADEDECRDRQAQGRVGLATKKVWAVAVGEQFRSLSLNLSVDGFGPYNEYIRYPSLWNTLTRNIEILRRRPNTEIIVIATLQMYNALNIVQLYRYLDSIRMDFYAYPVSWPSHLSPALQWHF